jgi:hypothetical protein
MADETPVIYLNGTLRRYEQGDATLDPYPGAGNGNP